MSWKEKYNTYVDSVEEAIELATQWHNEGKFNYFRGQAKNWEIYASMHRGGEKQFQESCDRMDLLYFFMKQNPVLMEYVDDADQFIAVAQHYGFATNYIDFTTDPEIAAYFATNSNDNIEGEYACIICVNHDHFHKVMTLIAPILDKYLKKGDLRPCFLKYEVKNLWRLQAQKGLFLYTPLAGMENLYCFNRILFPFKQPFKALNLEDIYPKAKSSVETYLDHFFTAERKSENMKRITDWLGEDRTTRLPDHNIFDYISNNCPVHYSWKSKQSTIWKIIHDEHWTKVHSKNSLNLDLSFSALRNWEDDELTAYVESKLKKTPDCRTSISKIKVNRYKIPFNKKLDQYIQEGSNLIWNGMRVLPYTNRQISSALVRFVIMMTYDHRHKSNDFRPLIYRSLYVGMSGAEGSGARAYVSGYRVLRSKRSAIYKYIKKENRKITVDNPIALLQLINNPRYLFQFDLFCELFAMDVIPSQTVLQIQSKNPVIYFNPKHVNTFGMA